MASAASNSAFRLRESARVMFPRVVVSRPPRKRSAHVNAYLLFGVTLLIVAKASLDVEHTSAG